MPTKKAAEIDPVTAEVIRNRLMFVVREMSVTMERASYTPVFTEGKDFSCAIFDRHARLISMTQWEYGCPGGHVGALPLLLQAIIDEIGLSNIKPGDSFLSNDPYIGGTHLPDYAVVTPVFYEDRLIAFCIARGHHVDVGGVRPGSFSPDADSIFSEGLKVPLVRIYKEGVLDQDIFKIILRNVRVKEQQGDFAAQIAATRKGCESLVDLVKRFGEETYEAAMDYCIDYSEKRFRSEIEKIPDGEYGSESYIVGDGITDKIHRIALKTTIVGSNINYDFSGTDEQCRGSMNVPLASTCGLCLVATIGILDPEIPLNAGACRPIKIIAPHGSLVNCKWPAATCTGHQELSQKLADAILGSLIQAAPEKGMAGEYATCNNIIISGVDPRTGSSYINFLLRNTGGWGATKGGDGLDTTFFFMAGAGPEAIPVEAYESKFPVLTKRLEVITDSGGPGKWRGGVTHIGEYTSYPPHEAYVGIATARVFVPTWGAYGGKPGLESQSFIRRKTGEEEHLLPISFGYLNPGDSFINWAAGGGGYGDPLERELELVQQDVSEGKVSIDGARRDYGVVIDPKSYEVDVPATQELRKQLKATA